MLTSRPLFCRLLLLLSVCFLLLLLSCRCAAACQGDMQIFVKHADGAKTTTLNVSAPDTIEVVETLFAGKAGMPRNSFHLTFAGKQLEKDSTLVDNNIMDNSTLNMHVGLRGGMPKRRAPGAAAPTREEKLEHLQEEAGTLLLRVRAGQGMVPAVDISW